MYRAGARGTQEHALHADVDLGGKRQGSGDEGFEDVEVC